MKNDLDNNRLVAEQVTAGDQGAENVDGFTPGPWQVLDYSSGKKGFIAVVSRPDKHIADVFPFGTRPGGTEHNLERHKANAHLISAAPDLLRACEDCMENRGDWGSLMADAIRKARGEQ